MASISPIILLISLLLLLTHPALSDHSPPHPPSLPPSPSPPADQLPPSPASPSSAPSPSPSFSSPPAPPPSDLAPKPHSHAPTPHSSPTPSPTPSPSPPPAADINRETDPNAADLESKESSGGMNGGQKLGVAFGVIAGAFIVGAGALVYKKRQQNIQRSQFGSAARRDIL